MPIANPFSALSHINVSAESPLTCLTYDNRNILFNKIKQFNEAIFADTGLSNRKKSTYRALMVGHTSILAAYKKDKQQAELFDCRLIFANYLQNEEYWKKAFTETNNTQKLKKLQAAVQQQGEYLAYSNAALLWAYQRWSELYEFVILAQLELDQYPNALTETADKIAYKKAVVLFKASLLEKEQRLKIAIESRINRLVSTDKWEEDLIPIAVKVFNDIGINFPISLKKIPEPQKISPTMLLQLHQALNKNGSPVLATNVCQKLNSYNPIENNCRYIQRDNQVWLVPKNQTALIPLTKSKVFWPWNKGKQLRYHWYAELQSALQAHENLMEMSALPTKKTLDDDTNWNALLVAQNHWELQLEILNQKKITSLMAYFYKETNQFIKQEVALTLERQVQLLNKQIEILEVWLPTSVTDKSSSFYTIQQKEHCRIALAGLLDRARQIKLYLNQVSQNDNAPLLEKIAELESSLSSYHTRFEELYVPSLYTLTSDLPALLVNNINTDETKPLDDYKFYQDRLAHEEKNLNQLFKMFEGQRIVQTLVQSKASKLPEIAALSAYFESLTIEERVLFKDEQASECLELGQYLLDNLKYQLNLIEQARPYEACSLPLAEEAIALANLLKKMTALILNPAWENGFKAIIKQYERYLALHLDEPSILAPASWLESFELALKRLAPSTVIQNEIPSMINRSNLPKLAADLPVQSDISLLLDIKETNLCANAGDSTKKEVLPVINIEPPLSNIQPQLMRLNTENAERAERNRKIINDLQGLKANSIFQAKQFANDCKTIDELKNEQKELFPAEPENLIAGGTKALLVIN